MSGPNFKGTSSVQSNSHHRRPGVGTHNGGNHHEENDILFSRTPFPRVVVDWDMFDIDNRCVVMFLVQGGRGM